MRAPAAAARVQLQQRPGAWLAVGPLDLAGPVQPHWQGPQPPAQRLQHLGEAALGRWHSGPEPPPWAAPGARRLREQRLPGRWQHCCLRIVRREPQPQLLRERRAPWDCRASSSGALHPPPQLHQPQHSSLLCCSSGQQQQLQAAGNTIKRLNGASDRALLQAT